MRAAFFYNKKPAGKPAGLFLFINNGSYLNPKFIPNDKVLNSPKL